MTQEQIELYQVGSLKFIDTLDSNQVFIFGSNESAFHGAGSAGYAMLHVVGNKWRTTCVPGTTQYLNHVPFGTKGYWAVKGCARGFQEGLYGKSYAIATVTKPGQRRSITRYDICQQLIDLWRFAIDRDELTFFMTPVGCKLAGYSEREMSEVLEWVIEKYTHPENIIIPNGMYNSVDWNIT